MTSPMQPYGPLMLEPATAVFHYGQEIFEGLKAYRHAAGTIAAFRPDANAVRFNRSAARLAMPALPTAAFVEAIGLLVSQDRDWVPAADGQSLYLRPFMIATQRGLGVNRPSSEYRFTVIGRRWRRTFKQRGAARLGVAVGGLHPCRPGGTGEAKCGGNYAAAFACEIEAQPQRL